MNGQRSKGGSRVNRLLVFLAGLLLGGWLAPSQCCCWRPRRGKDTVADPEARRKAAPSGG